MPSESPVSANLDAALAARVLHDVAGQASGLIAAFDLIADSASAPLRDEALGLAEQSARALARYLALQRAVIAGGDRLSRSALETAARDVFAGARGRLELHVRDEAPGPMAGRVLLGLLQVVRGGTAGSEVLASLEALHLVVTVRGARARLLEEERRGLEGDGPGEGQPHRWALPYWIWKSVGEAGGRIAIYERDGAFSIEAHMARAMD